MNLYFAGSISGGRAFLSTYVDMVTFLQNKEHVVLTEHIIKPDVVEHENQYTDIEIFERDMAWLRQSDALIAEVSNPSLGVGIEIATALQQDKPVLCLVHNEVFLTKMITGNRHPSLRVVRYEKCSDWQRTVDDFLDLLS
ncbi:MAG: nucleoside 2-deoxyribosyltransferase [candidate division KSB1 bacterium]|nr:nucleoside 2-deoxyribosyltransferase [candidate division KSB1 bacterium]